MKRTVEEMVSCGESENTVARGLGIDVDTMRKHFPNELLNGGSKRRKELIELLFSSARKGNVSAQKKLVEMTAVAAAAAEFERPEAAAAPVKAPKRGKKELADEAASTAGIGTDWKSDLETPPLPGAKPN